jgi:hypothetical protein
MHATIFRAILAIGLCFSLFTPAKAQIAAQWDPFFAAPVTIGDFYSPVLQNPRTFGIAAGDFTNDDHVDLVIGRALGQVYLSTGDGLGGFTDPLLTQLPWKQTALNTWAFAAGDLNADTYLDVIWGATAASSGCTVIVPSGQTCAGVGGTTITVNDGEVRVFYGNGDGTFQQNPYYVSTALHNAGTLLADIGTDAGSLTTGDVDGDNDLDVIAGGGDTSFFYVKLLRQGPAGIFTIENIVNIVYTTALTAPVYYPPLTLNVSPWGLAAGDIDGDGDLDLWVCDRGLYVYYYQNDGGGIFTLIPGNKLAGRENAFLVHDSYRAALGYTGSLGSGDINGDGMADLAIGLQSGGQSAPVANDGNILLDVSAGTDFLNLGSVADIGMIARGVIVIDVNEDGYLDIIGGDYAGRISYLRQLAPLDTDLDGISDYLDNAPLIANAPRLDMNTDASRNYHDQLDNDFDTVLGDPEIPDGWIRLGDVADPDDDNDTLGDDTDNCVYVANPDQADIDLDGIGDACDPLEDIDTDGDSILDGPMPADPYYAEALAAKIKMSQGSTYFIIRIDALGRWFQNEFTQIMTDAGILDPDEWAIKCWENYQSEDGAYEPCGTDEGLPGQTLELAGGKQVPISLVVIPKQLWTDEPVVTWINDRNDQIELEIAQHGSYHTNNTPNGDWADDPALNIYSCETCGLSEAENFEFLKVGYDTLVGNYSNKWVAESGATISSPFIDWSTSINPLISYAPPYNASDTLSRDATAQLGYKSFSASKYEELSEYLGWAFSPEGSHMEDFDPFGMFHASADLQVNPPLTPGDVYDATAYTDYLNSITEIGGLNTWLIEEVEWSGRPNNTEPREEGNRENNTVYLPRWAAWMTLLDFVKSYPDGVALTLGEVALAKAFDNAPTVSNPGQADENNNGIGDVIEGVTLTAAPAELTRNQTGTLAITLENGYLMPLADQTVTFSFDQDGDGTAETFTDITNAAGLAEVSVITTRPAGAYTFNASWDGLRGVTAETMGIVFVKTALFLPLITR